MTRLDDLPQMEREWKAWGSVMVELRQVLPEGADVNDPKFKPLVSAIGKWGEELATLRAGQTPTIRADALKQMREKYPQYAVKGEKGWE